MILKLIHLETKKYQLKTYFLAIGIISLVILGFLYTFALMLMQAVKWTLSNFQHMKIFGL